VVEEEQRRSGTPLRQQLGLGQEQRQDGHSLLALRAVAPEVAAAGRDSNVVEMRPEAGRTSLEITIQTCVQLIRRRCVAFVCEQRTLEPQLRRALGKER